MTQQLDSNTRITTHDRTAHVVSTFETREFGADTVRVGDLNGDGAPDLLFVQTRNQIKPGTSELLCRTRKIRCLTATTIGGELLWQYGEPSLQNGCNTGDMPVQVYDWDGDGENEVLFIRQASYAEMYPDDPPEYRGRAKRYDGTATLVILDGASGQEKLTLPLPAPADDSIVFADLTGRGRREDFVVKDAYGENVYGISRSGEFLWHWHGGPWPVAAHNMPHEHGVFVDDPLCEAGHYPAVADIDGDGCDEVFIGYALIDHDGHVVFRKDTDGHHQDAVFIARLDSGEWRLLYGNGGVHSLAPDGTELWSNSLVFNEAQHVVVGHFRADSELQVAVIDRGAPRTPEGEPGCLYLFDLETGRELWRRPQLPGGWCAACMDVRWSGDDELQELLVYKRSGLSPGDSAAIAVYDGQGEIVADFAVPADILEDGSTPSGYPGDYACMRADVWGDRRDEVIVIGRNGVRIYANRRALPIPTLYNNTAYHGM
jgi:hypothetical protein